MKLVPDWKNDDETQTFRWMNGEDQVAIITIYKDGLVEFSSEENTIAIENIGTKDESVDVGNVTLVANPGHRH